jgi:molecular chaperone DnaJ
MDPYLVLGVERDATQEEIAKAYRSLAVKYHPDRNPDDLDGASDKFKQATAAYEMIGTEEKRSRHDFYARQPASFSFRSRNSVDEVFDNLFSQFFGGGGKGGGPMRSRIKVTLAEAYSGCTKIVKSESKEKCSPCTGTGATRWSRCGTCSGTGFIFSNDGMMRVQTACANCSGRGSTPEQNCSECNGRGYKVVSERDVEVSIPAGVDEGTQIRVSGDSGPASDLFVVVSVDKDPRIERRQRSLFASVEVPYATLVLGGEASLALFGTNISIKIPRGTKSGARMRLAGRGMPHMQSPSARGDLFVDVSLAMPSVVSKEHERLLSRLAKIEAKNYSKAEEKI